MSDERTTIRARCSRCGRYFTTMDAAAHHVAAIHKGDGQAVPFSKPDEELSEWQIMHQEKGLPL